MKSKVGGEIAKIRHESGTKRLYESHFCIYFAHQLCPWNCQTPHLGP